MSFQFKKAFSCRHVEMKALSNVSFSVKGADGGADGGGQEGVFECQLMG